LDVGHDVVEGQPRVGIDRRPDAGTLGAVQHVVDSNGLDQQFERALRVQYSIVIELAHAVAESTPRAPRGRRIEAAELKGHRTAAMRDEYFQVGKVVEHGRVYEAVS